MSHRQRKSFYSGSRPVRCPYIFTAVAEEESSHPVLEENAPTSPPTRTYTLPSLHLPKFPQKMLFGVGFLLLAGTMGLALASFTHTDLRGTLQVIMPKPSTTLVVATVSTGVPQGINFDVAAADARVEIVASFLTRYNSPLTPAETYAQALVAAADRYNLDYRLLPAIMMQESNLCKTSDPALHNCLGFGIHSRGTLGFDSYEEGFDRAARELKERYIDIGLVTPEQIMTKYTPSSNGSWAASVNQWIAEMEHNDRRKGISEKQDANLTQYTGL